MNIIRPLLLGVLNGFLTWFLFMFGMMCLFETFPYIIWHWGNFDDHHGWAAIIWLSFVIEHWWVVFPLMILFFFVHFFVETWQRDRISKNPLS